MTSQQRNIEKEISLIPEGKITRRDLDDFFSAVGAEITCEIELPGAGSETVEGQWTEQVLNITSREARLNITLVDDMREAVESQVALAVSFDAELIQDLGVKEMVCDLDEESLEGEITSGQVAQELADQAGITLGWDSALDYPVVTVLNPIWYFEGTFREALEKLLAPFNQYTRMAEVVYKTDRVDVLYTGIPESADLTISMGSGFFHDRFSIRRKAPEKINKISRLWIRPKSLEEIVETWTEDAYDEDGKLIAQTVIYRTIIGPVIKNEKRDYYSYQYVVTGWSGGVPTIGEEWRLERSEDIEYEYDPTITPTKAFYRRDIALKKKTSTTVIQLYMAEATKTITETVDYSYNDDNQLIREGQRKETTSSNTDITTGEDRIINYEQVTGDLVTTRTMRKPWTLYPSQESAIEGDATITQQTFPGELSGPPDIPMVQDDRFLDLELTEEIIDGKGRNIEAEYDFDGESIWDDLKEKVTAQVYDVNILGRGAYELSPGTWIALAAGVDQTITLKTATGDQTKSLSQILAELPLLFVSRVNITRTSREQLIDIRARGWKATS